jgi:hypothetical protein
MVDGARYESECQTRRRIDPKLEAQAWTIAAFNESTRLFSYAHHAIAEYPTDNGPADEVHKLGWH